MFSLLIPTCMRLEIRLMLIVATVTMSDGTTRLLAYLKIWVR